MHISLPFYNFIINISATLHDVHRPRDYKSLIFSREPQALQRLDYAQNWILHIEELIRLRTGLIIPIQASIWGRVISFLSSTVASISAHQELIMHKDCIYESRIGNSCAKANITQTSAAVCSALNCLWNCVDWFSNTKC